MSPSTTIFGRAQSLRRFGKRIRLGEFSFRTGAGSGRTHEDFFPRPKNRTKYTHDTLGDMTSIEQTVSGEASKYVKLSYDGDSRVHTIDRYASNAEDAGATNLVATSTCAYDADSQLTDLSYSGQNGTLAAYHWTYYADGAVSDCYSRNDSDLSSTTPTADYTTWADTHLGYDATAQLTSTSYTNFANRPAGSASQTYDSNGNRTNVAPPLAAASTTGAGNRLLFDGTYYYTYDADGNRTAKFKSDTGVLDTSATDITTYQWNNAGQLTQVETFDNYADYSATPPSPSQVVTYAYDPFGQMVTRTEGGTTENFVYDGEDPVLVLAGNGQVIERELNGAAVDQVLASESVASGTVSWLLTDNQGTVRDVAVYDSTTQTTSISDHLVYTAFAQITWQSSAIDQPRFTSDGRQYDSASALYYNRTRWYDAVDAVFASQDPTGLGPDVNPYQYCGNSPTNYSDPSGMAPIPVSPPGVIQASPSPPGTAVTSYSGLPPCPSGVRTGLPTTRIDGGLAPGAIAPDGTMPFWALDTYAAQGALAMQAQAATVVPASPPSYAGYVSTYRCPSVRQEEFEAQYGDRTALAFGSTSNGSGSDGAVPTSRRVCLANKPMLLLTGPALIQPLLMHYYRNIYNRDPQSIEDAEQNWVELTEDQRIYHCQGKGNENNRKFVTPNGHCEAIYKGTEIIQVHPTKAYLV